MLGKVRSLVTGGEPVSRELRQLFKDWPDGQEETAKLFEAFVTKGQRATELAALTPAQGQAWLGRLTDYHWSERLEALVKQPQKMTAKQWLRLGQALTRAPSRQPAPAPAPDAPEWLSQLQLHRAHAADHHEVWQPDFLAQVLAAADSPDPARAALAAFWHSFDLAKSWMGSPLRFWRYHGREPAARAWVDYVAANIDTAAATLAETSATARAEALRWLALYPDLNPPLAPLLAGFAADQTKTIRELALDLIIELSPPLRTQTLASALERSQPAALPALADRIARLGEEGRRLIEGALGQGGKRDQQLRAVLDRLALASQPPPSAPLPDAAAAGWQLPPLPPTRPVPEPATIIPAMEAALAKEIAAVEKLSGTWWKEHLASLRKIDRATLTQLVNYLGQATDRPPKGLDALPSSLARFVPQFPLAGVVRFCVNRHGKSLKIWELRRLAGYDHDLRAVAEALAQAGVANPVGLTADLAFGYGELRKTPPRHVWPFFALHPERLEQALGVTPNRTNDPDQETATALEIAAMFPSPLPSLVPVLAELATGGKKRFRRAAQDLLRTWPTAVELATQNLASPSQELRAGAAAWLARIGQPAAVEPLRQALAKEKREPVQAALLSALAALGEDISQHLTPAALAHAAAKGLTSKRPASMDWFPLDALPQCRWADGQTVEPAIIQWWAVLADKLKDPSGAGLIPLYVGLLDKASREELGRFALEAWIAHDTAHPSDEESRAYAAAEAPATWQSNQDSAKKWPK
ncbi:MAG: hypothetical protein LBU05_01475, partial [Bifidobacteriaceae bacterium]|nr:hypothetical protein [Bifidobacteriaceae bacterium]